MRRILAGACLIGVVGCGATFGEGWQLAGEPGLMTKVRTYYSQHALEEGGQCPWPIMEGVTRETVLEDDEEHLEVLVRYAYRDFVRDADEDCSRFRPNRCWIMVPCRGFAERTFTIARTGAGLEVVGMTGEQRRRSEGSSR